MSYTLFIANQSVSTNQKHIYLKRGTIVMSCHHLMLFAKEVYSSYVKQLFEIIKKRNT